MNKRRASNPRWGRSAFAAAIAVILLVPFVSFAARGTQSAPKLLNLYLGWRIADTDKESLSNWDLVVLDMDMQWQSPERIREIRRKNPRMKILAYVSAGELAEARGQGDPSSPGYRLAQSASEAAYLHRADGRRLSWWPGAYLMNVTDRAPRVDGKQWGDVLAAFIRDDLMSTGLWDGVFLDSAYSNVTYFVGNDIDMNGDGRADSPQDVNASWLAGMTRFIANVRSAVGPSRLVMNNSSPAYASLVNGALFENFPRSGWSNVFRDYQTSIQKNVAPTISALNTNTNNEERPNDYQLMRFGLTTSLLGDGYFSFDAGDVGHDRTWWYDEYDASLGAPRGSAKRIGGTAENGVWLRIFDRGIVVVNADSVPQTVPLPGAFETIHGTQDPRANSGAIVRSIDLAAHDGRILLGRADVTEVTGGAFANGSFVRVYAADGAQIRNGFFAQQTDAPGGAPTIAANLDGKGPLWIVSAQNGAVSVRSPAGQTSSFSPFGSTYHGRLSIAVGNANIDADLELIVGRDKAKPSDVRVFTRNGTELAGWTAYNPAFSGGARVGIGDLNGDGQREIVTGAGPGGGPHVRIFAMDGTPGGGSFFAFSDRERGGITIAVGDVDGDNKDEIIAGSGEGAIPRVRIFDYRGTLKTELTLGSQPVLSGITVTAADVNGDGRKDILVSGLPVF